MGDHALGLAGKLTTGITLALVAASVAALAVLSATQREVLGRMRL
jgi:hypothetical protein